MVLYCSERSFSFSRSNSRRPKIWGQQVRGYLYFKCLFVGLEDLVLLELGGVACRRGEGSKAAERVHRYFNYKISTRLEWRRKERKGEEERESGWLNNKSERVDHFFFLAEAVTLPVSSFLSTLLMIPTATVCFMSRTAKRPRGG